MGKTYCILGGGGAFGIHTALYILDTDPGARVVGVGRNPLRPSAFTLGVERRPRFEYRAFHVGHETDLLLEFLDDLQPDVIVNFAAQGEGAASWRHSWRFFDTNSTALARLHEELSHRGWFNPRGHFIQIGTSELYGSVARPAAEDAPLVPSSPYSASKAAFDLYLLALSRARRGAPTTILRPSNAYCSGQLLHRIIPRAVVAGLTGRRVPLHGGGRAEKSYIHARDLARAIYLAATEEAPLGAVYNIGPPAPTAIRDVAQLCAAAVGVEFDALFEVAEERVGQDSRYWLDSSAALRDFGWRPEVGWVAGLGEVVSWAKANLDVLRDWPTDYQLRA